MCADHLAWPLAMHGDVVEDGLYRFWRRCLQTCSLRIGERDPQRLAEVLNSIPEPARTSTGTSCSYS